MPDTENQKFLERIESEVIRMGGRIKAGIIAKTELEDDEEIRVSIRSSRLPSVELFTLRNVEPADYHLLLVAIPRKKEVS
jgi:hypothetical protein